MLNDRDKINRPGSQHGDFPALLVMPDRGREREERNLTQQRPVKHTEVAPTDRGLRAPLGEPSPSGGGQACRERERESAGAVIGVKSRGSSTLGWWVWGVAEQFDFSHSHSKE